MSVDPIRIAQAASAFGGVERATGKPVERTADGEGDVGAATAPSLNQTSELRQYVAATPTVSATRTERVAALRAAVAQGIYKVPLETLARKLLGGG